MHERIDYIEIEHTDAYLDYNISFIHDLYKSVSDFMNIRRANLQVTDIVWIYCRLRIWHNELYNAKTPILLFLN